MTRSNWYGLLACFAAVIASATEAPVADHQYSDAQLNQLMAEGNQLVQRGSPKAAVNEKYDVVIDHYKKTYADPSQQIFTAHSQGEALIYSALGATLNKDTLVINGLWSDAYLMKGYALIDLGEVEAAREALEAAVALSPQNSQYLSELGYWHQVNRDWQTSLSLYERAADAATFVDDKQQQTNAITRAWRGQGYALVELDRLDEANALYQKCLKRDKKDEKARGELRYVEQQLAMKRKG